MTGVTSQRVMSVEGEEIPGGKHSKKDDTEVSS